LAGPAAPHQQEGAVNPSLRFDILRRDGFTCRYCGRRPPAVVLEVDHIHPKSAGGRDTEANLVTACFSCNRGKRDAVGVLPAPNKPIPAEYPVGFWFHVRRHALGWKPTNGLVDVAYNGYVVAVQGDFVWVNSFDMEDGWQESIVALPRNGWRGWTFFPTNEAMRRAYLYLEVRLGLSDSSDIAAFEADPRQPSL
jgi:hypothetical protein